ncbi:hypothetical protein AYI70_g169 [Smittium culicis]|uniref:Inner centromere protein ARK-binding domain-containing protein n=1 Tax=Smittium culicis TaxID=133412 RepID=A0A1R1YHT5_9FUNG|nr:hypothetical protein AYI70_g169 [Smittium culicis]
MFKIAETGSWIKQRDFEWDNSLKRKLEYLEATTIDNKNWLSLYFENFRQSYTNDNQFLFLSSTFKSTRTKKARNRYRADVRNVFDQDSTLKNPSNIPSKPSGPHFSSTASQFTFDPSHNSLNDPIKTKSSTKTPINSTRLSYYSTLNNYLDFSKSTKSSNKNSPNSVPFLYVDEMEFPKNDIIIEIGKAPDFGNTSIIDPSIEPTSLKKSFFYNLPDVNPVPFDKVIDNASRHFNNSNSKNNLSHSAKNSLKSPSSKHSSAHSSFKSSTAHQSNQVASKPLHKTNPFSGFFQKNTPLANKKSSKSKKTNQGDIFSSATKISSNNLQQNNFNSKSNNRYSKNCSYSSPTTKNSNYIQRNNSQNSSSYNKEPRSSISISDSVDLNFISDSASYNPSLSREENIKEMLLNSSNSSNSSITYDDSVISRRSSNTQASNSPKSGRRSRKSKKPEFIIPFSDSNKSSKNNSPKIGSNDPANETKKPSTNDINNNITSQLPPQSNIGIMPDIKTIPPSALAYSHNATTTNNWISADQASIVMSQGFDIMNNNSNKFLFNNSSLYLSPNLINQNDNINRILSMGYNQSQFQLSENFNQNSISTSDLSSSIIPNDQLNSEFNAMNNYINIDQMDGNRMNGVNPVILTSNPHQNYNTIINDQSFSYMNTLNNNFIQPNFTTINNPNSNLSIASSLLMAPVLDTNSISKDAIQSTAVNNQSYQFDSTSGINLRSQQTQELEAFSDSRSKNSPINRSSESINSDHEVELNNNHINMLDFVPLKPIDSQPQGIVPTEIDTVLDISLLSNDISSVPAPQEYNNRTEPKSAASGLNLSNSTTISSIDVSKSNLNYDSVKNNSDFIPQPNIQDNLSNSRENNLNINSANSYQNVTPLKNSESFEDSHTTIIPPGKNSPPEIISDDDDDPENEDLIYELMGDLPPNASPQTILAAQKMAKKKLKKIRNPHLLSTPPWAKTPQLIKSLSNQQTVNPDLIFGAVKPIRVEEIFKNPNAKNFSAALARAQGISAMGRNRQSSGIWTGSDALSSAEVEEYNKKMGYN